MKTTFAAAAFAGFALAQKGGMRGMKDMYKEKDFGGSKLGSGGFRPSGNGGNNAQFLTYLSTNNKSYSTPREMALRAQLYNDNAAEVRELNRKSRASGRKDAAKFETNFLSDLTAEEKKKLTGWREDNRLSRTKLYHQRDGRGRRLIADATTVDHVKDGNMGAVKDQGYCGSCWAFAANTVLEGQVKIKTGVLKRISEQHLVDCSLHTVTQFNTRYWNYGCNGGWMSEAWKFQKNEGYMHNEDYKYESDTTYTEGACRHNNNKIIGNVTKIGKIDGSGSLEGLKEQVKKGPMTIAIDAGDAVFQNYKSGVIQAGDGCGTGLNHAVVIVGYSSGGSDGGDDTDPTPEPEPEPIEECTVFKWWHSCPDGADRRMLADS